MIGSRVHRISKRNFCLKAAGLEVSSTCLGINSRKQHLRSEFTKMFKSRMYPEAMMFLSLEVLPKICPSKLAKHSKEKNKIKKKGWGLMIRQWHFGWFSEHYSIFADLFTHSFFFVAQSQSLSAFSYLQTHAVCSPTKNSQTGSQPNCSTKGGTLPSFFSTTFSCLLVAILLFNMAPKQRVIYFPKCEKTYASFVENAW